MAENKPTLLSPCQAETKGSRLALTDGSVTDWKERGFCLVNGVHEDELILKARSECYEVVNDSYFGNETKVFGSAGKLEFPSLCPSLNELFVHPRLLGSVEQLLGTERFIICQGDAWAKTGVGSSSGRDYFSNTEQRMHMDFPNHDLNHPPPFDSPEVVAVIIYLDDSEGKDGRTGLVPREGADDSLYSWPYDAMPGFGEIPWINDREQAESYLEQNHPDVFKFRQKLYEREQLANYTTGTVLFYRHDVWHRGRPILPDKTRLVCNLVFKKCTPRINHWSTGFARQFYNIKAILNRIQPQMKLPRVGSVEHFFVKLSPFQRSILGFPPPGDEYWNEKTLLAAKRRWGVLGMDLTPYDDAFYQTTKKARN
mmetsp:Transcript_6765/g.7770  ORF Transcript_6765/g.7770 Transcript_6765/m.7770 type:complete len:369 (-) Transcript_6765:243-1349(-)|eukprot:CAMPEP_0184032494 /NCGR_PEP_ID=MMETSP0955-20130417/3072_1 /TAXON_ID=627963 /ORGANISM="Aplanochytrium sp, Strain PBS07" /LENGTH=368 /DNA_ID=CAMNT_0026318577 /DNA_START=108 /DNA_END=1214 /DNA_ORIENTATION=+